MAKFTGLAKALEGAEAVMPDGWLLEIAPLYEGGYEVLAYNAKNSLSRSQFDDLALRSRKLFMGPDLVRALNECRSFFESTDTLVVLR